MADTNTTKYGFTKPEVGASSDTWGAKLNTGLDDLDALLGATATTGSANAYVLTTGLSLAAYVDGQSWLVRASFANTGGATIAVDGLLAKNLRKMVGGVLTALASGDINSGDYLRLAYNLSSDVVVIVGGIGQPLDATLTALAALAWSSGSPVVQFTAADTVSLTLTPSLTDVTVSGVFKAPGGSAAAVSYSHSGAAGTGMYFVTTSQVNFAISGTLRATLSASALASGTVVFTAADGGVGAPGLSFTNDPDNGWYRIGANNWAGTTGGTKFVDYSTTLVDFTLPVRARVPTSTETTGTLTAASANKKITATGGITLPASVMTTDDAIVIDGGGTARTITRGVGLTMYVNGVDSATATLTANGVMGVHFRSATVCILTGNVS